ncbi:sulfatase-like hydrolase/transferase [uncultured Polaribacter sp.]|uniref:sulfatase-like hydrolase/transferase n=1 Tax=uncultured Polaribacter sp. TaxID=174711 RepID=UPI00261519E3|nr:sulfatase-like hydrolase/transferase [uncultured Polaribacter sp.]
MNLKNSLTFIIVFFLLISCKLNSDNAKFKTTNSTKNNKPNIIVILIDDAGYVDFGFMGSEDLQTPNIDKLAKSGVVFTDAHVSATVCAPSRAGLITGIYQQRFGFEANGTGGIGLSDDITTIADVFKENDYNTYAIGKWHLGEDVSDHPNQRGFDNFYGFINGSRSYFPIQNPSKNQMLQNNGERVVFDGYMTDVLGNQSVKYIEASKDKPFFMYLAYNAVHTPMHAKKEHLEKFKNHPRKELAAMTWSLDENIGKLINKLESLGIRDNTLIYFLSDNGGAHNNQSKTGVLKGWKGNKFEGGHRVPFIMSWPNKLNNNKVFSGLTSSLDIFATSIAAANIYKDNLELDGVNLIPYLMDKKHGNPHKNLFWKKLDISAARIGDYKLITLEKQGSVLYNLKEDLRETKNIIYLENSVSENIQITYNKWEHSLMKPLWGEGKSWESVTRHIHKRLMQNKEADYKDIWSPAFKKIDSKK